MRGTYKEHAMTPQHLDELQAIEARYARRSLELQSSLYDPLDPYVSRAAQERERALIRCIHRAGKMPVGEKRVLEVGCGCGANLIDLIRLGFRPPHLVGNELREDRLAEARDRLPQTVTLLAGDASTLDLEEESFDIVLQSTVFTSILDDGFQQRLADRMWSWVRPGGGILWYDFIWNNPRDPDVRGACPSDESASFSRKARWADGPSPWPPRSGGACVGSLRRCTPSSTRCRCCGPTCCAGSGNTPSETEEEMTRAYLKGTRRAEKGF